MGTCPCSQNLNDGGENFDTKKLTSKESLVAAGIGLGLGIGISKIPKKKKKRSNLNDLSNKQRKSSKGNRNAK